MNLTIGREIEQEFVDLINSLPKAIREIEGIEEVDPFELARAYFEAEEVVDMTIDPNANVTGKSPVNFHSEIEKPLMKLRSYHLLWKNLYKRYGKDEAHRIIMAVFDGLLYFHDVTKIDVPYCFAPDTTFLMFEGRPYGWLPSTPPNKLTSFMGQLREMTMDYSQENAGAIGIANALINMAYYTRNKREQLHKMVDAIKGVQGLDILIRQFSDNEAKYQKYSEEVFPILQEGKGFHGVADYLLDKEIEDEIQQTVHIFHNTFRIGGDSPFTNISLFDEPTIRKTFKDSMYPDRTFAKDNIPEIMRVQKIYAEFFAKGSPKTNKPYRFPVTTVNIAVDDNGKIIDKDFFNYMADLNREKGVFNWHKGEKIASCCRLTSDLAALKEQVRMDSFGNGGLSIGSHRVVAINLHRVALMAQEAKGYGSHLTFMDILRDAMRMAEKLLIVHKLDILQKRIESGVLKFFNIKWADMSMFFSTFGFTGLHDAYMVGKDKFDVKDYMDFGEKTLGYMERFAHSAGERNEDFAFNVEEIPGENAAPKLAKKDNYYYNTDKQLLSNQMVPLYEDIELFDRLKISSRLMNIVSGGAILHLNVADNLTIGANRELLRRLIEDYDIPHFALNKGFSTCVNKHTTVGVHSECPECGGKIDTYTTRVVGFFTDTKDWIKARRVFEFPRRRWYGKEETINA